MVWIEILGNMATLVSVGAMVFKDMVKLRAISIVGSSMWIVYGANVGAMAIITSSIAFIGVNGHGIYKELQNRKKGCE